MSSVAPVPCGTPSARCSRTKTMLSRFGEKFGRVRRHFGQDEDEIYFIQVTLFGFALYLIKNSKTEIPSSKGVDLLTSEIEAFETSSKMPCFAAAILSHQSMISGRGNPLTNVFLSRNGHTLMVCVNDISEQAQMEEEETIYIGVMKRIDLHVKAQLDYAYYIYNLGDYDTGIPAIDRVLGLLPGSRIERLIIEAFDSTGEPTYLEDLMADAEEYYDESQY